MVLAALAVRLVLVGIGHKDLLDTSGDYFSFGWETGRVARSIASGHGFGSPFQGDTGLTAALPPLYPYVLAGIFKLFGIYTRASALAILSLQSLLSALTCLPIFFIAGKTFGERVARWAGWSWAFFPYAVYISAHEVWETSLTTLLLSLLFLLALRMADAADWRAWLGFGLLWGVVALTSPAMLAVLPVMGGWICLQLRRRGKPWAGGAATSALVFLLCVSPWFVRNYRTFGRFIPFRSNFGLELYVGNSMETDEYWHAWNHPAHNASELLAMQRLGEIAYMAEKKRQAFAFIRAHPGVFAWLTLKRVADVWTGVWNLSPNYLLANWDEALNIPFCTVISLLAFAGLYQVFRHDRETAWLYALVLAMEPAAFYITHVEVSYRHPIDPLLIVLAVLGGLKFSSRRSEFATTAGAPSGRL